MGICLRRRERLEQQLADAREVLEDVFDTIEQMSARIDEFIKEQKTMATEREYAAATEAARRLIQEDIDQEVPVFFRGQIPPGLAEHLGREVAKVVLDTVDKMRRG